MLLAVSLRSLANGSLLLSQEVVGVQGILPIEARPCRRGEAPGSEGPQRSGTCSSGALSEDRAEHCVKLQLREDRDDAEASLKKVEGDQQVKNSCEVVTEERASAIQVPQ